MTLSASVYGCMCVFCVCILQHQPDASKRDQMEMCLCVLCLDAVHEHKGQQHTGCAGLFSCLFAPTTKSICDQVQADSAVFSTFQCLFRLPLLFFTSFYSTVKVLDFMLGSLPALRAAPE